MNNKLQNILTTVRTKWNLEYSAFLKEKDRNRNLNSPAISSKSTKLIQKGDVVLIVGSNNSLTLGRVLQLLESTDGEVRRAEIKTKGGIRVHPVKNIRLFESSEMRDITKVSSQSGKDPVPTRPPCRD